MTCLLDPALSFDTLWNSSQRSDCSQDKHLADQCDYLCRNRYDKHLPVLNLQKIGMDMRYCDSYSSSYDIATIGCGSLERDSMPVWQREGGREEGAHGKNDWARRRKAPGSTSFSLRVWVKIGLFEDMTYKRPLDVEYHLTVERRCSIS